MRDAHHSEDKSGFDRRHVELRGLTKVYREGERDRVVLADVSLCVNRGEFVALLGPSGSGKSTLLNIISGIDTPTSGDVIVDSTNLTALSEKQRTLFRRHNIGFVFQFFNLIPTLTVEENLLLPLELKGKITSDEHEKVMELLSAVGLDDRAKSFPDKLSGGEQQRVAVARALVHDPSVILADEPTGNLDADTGGHVMDILHYLVRERGKTMVVVTHSDDVVSIADRVFSMEGAWLVEKTPKANP